MFCFASHFNSYFLLFTTLLALSFWSLVTLVRTVRSGGGSSGDFRVAARTIAVYLLACAAVFALLWLQSVVPATIRDTMPTAIEEAGLTQNPVWVLDFAFTFPLMVRAAIGCGSAAVGVYRWRDDGDHADDRDGRDRDRPGLRPPPRSLASLSAVPVMLAFTGAGLVFSGLFLNGVTEPS